MCGRMTLTAHDLTGVLDALDAELLPEHARLYRPRYNIAPADLHWIVRRVGAGRRLVPAAWGITVDTPTRRQLVINARAETARSKPAFRHAFSDRRCVVVADGFFEWTGPPSDRKPIWFHDPRGGPLLFAGLFEEAPVSPSPVFEAAWPRFTILTTAANELVAAVHDRMPALLSKEGALAWLDQAPAQLPVPAPGEWLVGTEVSQRANSTTNDDPACLEQPDPAVAESKQLRLL